MSVSKSTIPHDHDVKKNAQSVTITYPSKIVSKEILPDLFDKQQFTYGPLNKSLHTQKLELFTKCVLKNRHDIEFYSIKNNSSGKTDYHAKIADMDINVSELLKKANFSHVQLDQDYLTIEEKNAIKAYTGNEFQSINKLLWGKEISSWFQGYSDAFLKAIQIASGLNKIMPDTHNHSFTYRADKPSLVEIQERIDAIKKGDGITMTDAFFSTSLSKSTVDNFGGNTFIYFEDRYGKKISGLSYYPQEQEYLLEPTTLLWTKHEYVDGNHIFYARKVTPLIGEKDTPTHDDITMFKKLCAWAENHGVKTDFITPHLKSILNTEINNEKDDFLNDIIPKSKSVAIQQSDCISFDQSIAGLETAKQVSMSDLPEPVPVIDNALNIASSSILTLVPNFIETHQEVGF